MFEFSVMHPMFLYFFFAAPSGHEPACLTPVLVSGMRMHLRQKAGPSLQRRGPEIMTGDGAAAPGAHILPTGPARIHISHG